MLSSSFCKARQDATTYRIHGQGLGEDAVGNRSTIRTRSVFEAVSRLLALAQVWMSLGNRCDTSLCCVCTYMHGPGRKLFSHPRAKVPNQMATAGVSGIDFGGFHCKLRCSLWKKSVPTRPTNERRAETRSASLVCHLCSAGPVAPGRLNVEKGDAAMQIVHG